MSEESENSENSIFNEYIDKYDNVFLDEFLDQYKTSSSEEQILLLQYYNEGEGNITQLSLNAHQIFELEDLKILFELEDIDLSVMQFSEEAFEFLLAIASEQNFVEYTRYSRANCLAYIKTFHHFEIALIYQIFDPLKKYRSRSFYQYFNEQNIPKEEDLRKIIIFLYQAGLDLYENFTDLLYSHNLIYLEEFIAVEKITNHLYFSLADYEIHISLDYRYEKLMKKILSYHQPFASDYLNLKKYLGFANKYSDSYFKDYLAENLNKLTYRELEEIINYLMKMWYLRNLFQLWRYHEKYPNSNLYFRYILMEKSKKMIKIEYLETAIYDSYQIGRNYLELFGERVYEKYPNLRKIEKMMKNDKKFMKNRKELYQIIEEEVKK